MFKLTPACRGRSRGSTERQEVVLSGKVVDFFGCGCTMSAWDVYGPGVWSGHGGVSPEGRLWCALSSLVVARALQREFWRRLVCNCPEKNY